MHQSRSWYSTLRIPSFPVRRSDPPLIILTAPTEPVPWELRQPQKIRRWRGVSGSNGDLTLYPPSQGPTKGARLALARQGSATGSFRLNCAETLHAIDEHGRCLFQRMDLEEELETSKPGLMEGPIRHDISHPSPVRRQHTSANIATQHGRRVHRKDVRSLFLEMDSAALRKKARELLTPVSDRRTLGGMSCSHTFSGGLCNLAADDAAEHDSRTLASSATFHSLSSALDVGKKWFDSLKTKNNAMADKENDLERSFSTSTSLQSIRPPKHKLQPVPQRWDDNILATKHLEQDNILSLIQPDRASNKRARPAASRRTLSWSAVSAKRKLVRPPEGTTTPKAELPFPRLISESITIAGSLCSVAPFI